MFLRGKKRISPPSTAWLMVKRQLRLVRLLVRIEDGVPVGKQQKGHGLDARRAMGEFMVQMGLDQKVRDAPKKWLSPHGHSYPWSLWGQEY